MELYCCYYRAVTALLWLLALVKAFSESVGLRCTCTTHDCIRDNKTFCQDATWCYAQRMPPSGDGLPEIQRGCIQTKNPLLCENKRPRGGGERWPSLFCCRTDLCNQDVIPTPIPYPDKDSKLASTMDSKTNVNYYHRKENKLRISENKYNHISANAKSKYKGGINPIYIGIPLAGACVLLAMIIFTIFILKRQRTYQGPPVCEHNDIFGLTSIEQRHIYRPATARDKIYVVKHPGDMKPNHYTVTEFHRSSSESEATLLTKK